MTWRTSEATAAALDLPLTEFPSHHGGFLGGRLGDLSGATAAQHEGGCQPAGGQFEAVHTCLLLDGLWIRLWTVVGAPSRR